MKNIDFVRLDSAIDNLILNAKIPPNNESPQFYDLNKDRKMMVSNGLYVSKMLEEKENQQTIHKIDVEAIKDAIKSAIEKRNNKELAQADESSKVFNHIKVSPSAYMNNNQNALAISPILSYKIAEKIKPTVKEIIEMSKNGTNDKKYFFDGEKPFVIYDSNHNLISSTIYAAGLLDILDILEKNIFFRNSVHFSPYCKQANKLVEGEYKIAYGNNFEIEWFDNKIQVQHMPLCDECCNHLNIPNLAEHSDFVAMFGLVVSISVS